MHYPDETEFLFTSSRLICQNLATEAGKYIYQFVADAGKKNCFFNFEPEECDPLITNTTRSWVVYTNPDCNLN